MIGTTIITAKLANVNKEETLVNVVDQSRPLLHARKDASASSIYPSNMNRIVEFQKIRY